MKEAGGRGAPSLKTIRLRLSLHNLREHHHTSMPSETTITNVRRLLFAKNAPADKPFGTGSIFACLSLALGMIDGDTRKSLMTFLGLDDCRALAEQLHTYVNPSRILAVILSTNAKRSLDTSINGPLCYEHWDNLYASKMMLEHNIEAQVNKLAKVVFDTDRDIFSPFSIVKEEEVDKLIAALLSIENVVVSWKTCLDEHKSGYFQKSPGTVVPVVYCQNRAPIDMPFMRFGNGDKTSQAVLLSCEKNEHDQKQRGMVFVVPADHEATLNNTLDTIALCIQENKGFRFQTRKVDFKFPAFHVAMPPTSVMPFVHKEVPGLFTPDSGCMNNTINPNDIGGIAYVGNVIHSASIRADRKGATAKALTVIPTIVYRSLAVDKPDQEIVHCDRPFISMLVEIEQCDDDSTLIKSIEYVTKHETEQGMDLSHGEE